MLTPERKIYSANSLSYGWEWPLDAFDKHVDRLLLTQPLLPVRSEFPRVALDIGCGNGIRTRSLAQLGVFDKIIAIDIGDRSENILAINADLAARASEPNKPAASAEFLFRSVLDIDAESFKDMDVRFVNFRRVAHFFSPPNLIKALANIKAAANEDAIVAVSFDFRDNVSGCDSMEDTVESYEEIFRGNERHGAYGIYNTKRVEGYMRDLNFALPPALKFDIPFMPAYDDDESPANQASEFRRNEHAIIALNKKSRSTVPGF